VGRGGNAGGGYKRGQDDREGGVEQRDSDLRTKLRRDQDFPRGGHCFNCNWDGHYQASCPNPPFCYSCKKDGHRAMNCPAKKGMNLKLCGFGKPSQGFYSIQFPEEKDETNLKSFPGLLTIFEGVATEEIIKTELNYLFRGRTGWTISHLGENEFILYFPSDELTKFMSFEFATTAIKAKVEPTKLEKEVVSILEETWVKATGFPAKAQKKDIIREISYLVGDPIEVDEDSLLKGRAVRVKVWCKDPLKIEGSTMVLFNKQGHMITWWSEILESMKAGKSLDTKSSKFERHGEFSDDVREKDDSSRSHDSSFQRMTEEQKAEEKGTKRMTKTTGTKQRVCAPIEEGCHVVSV
jgi:hypothetical protein